jgi:hypothetical protein
LKHKIHNYDPVSIPLLQRTSVLGLAVQVEVVVEVEVKIEEQVEATVTDTELEVMDHPLESKLDCSIPMTTTVGSMVMIVQETMRADHVIIKHRVIKTQQQVAIQWVVP